LDDKREARAEGGRRFQREGPITEKDLDMPLVVLLRGVFTVCIQRIAKMTNTCWDSSLRGQRPVCQVRSACVTQLQGERVSTSMTTDADGLCNTALSGYCGYKVTYHESEESSF